MTFKHIKFGDSVTMRSLERIAIEKGLVSLEPLNKTASSIEKEDYTPSENLMENVIKLCAGLRGLGFEKHANELESKFVNYKRAFNAYETSKETGEDLVDAAHPDGSHTLRDVEGDAIIETIVDQHLKNVKIVEKTPTGKLASSKDIIRAVKLVLAQDVNVVRATYNELKILANNILAIYKNEYRLTRPTSSAGEDLVNLIDKSYEHLDHEAATLINVQLSRAYNDYKPPMESGPLSLLGGVSAEAWSQMKPLFNKAFAAVNEILRQTSGEVPYKAPVTDKPVPTTPTNVTGFDDQLRNVLVTLSRWSGVINSDPENTEADKKAALGWIDAKSSQVKNIKQVLDNTEVKDKEQVIPLLSKNLEKIKTYKPDPKTLNFDEFQRTWIG